MVGPTACARSAHRPPLYATTLPGRAKYPPTSDVFGSGSSGRGARAKCTGRGRAPRRQRPGAHTGKTLAFWPWRPPGHTGTGTRARAHGHGHTRPAVLPLRRPPRQRRPGPVGGTAILPLWDKGSLCHRGGRGQGAPRPGRSALRTGTAATATCRRAQGARVAPGPPEGAEQVAPTGARPRHATAGTRRPGSRQRRPCRAAVPGRPHPYPPGPRPHSGHRDRAGRRRPGGPAARTRPDELTGKRRSPRRSRAAPAAAGLQGLRDRRDRSCVGPGRCWLLAGRRAGPGAGAVRWRHRQPVRRAGWPTPSPVQGPQVGRLAGGTGGRLRAAGRPVATLAGTPGPPSRAFGRHRAYRPTRRALLPQGQRLKFN